MSNHFNGLTPAEAERLALALEELGEMQQAIGKILRHGYESYNPFDPSKQTNRQALEREVGDVYTSIYLLFQAGDIRRIAVATREDIKRESVWQWLHHQAITPDAGAREG